MDVVTAAIPLILKALWLSSRWAGILRVHTLKSVARDNDRDSEIVFLRDRVAQLAVVSSARDSYSRPRFHAYLDRKVREWMMEFAR